jgi:hypothetical protein
MIYPDAAPVPAAPCIAAWCATCEHAHVGAVCEYQIPRRAGDVIEHDPCGCEKFVRDKPTRCAFNCMCDSPKCGCTGHCTRHADAILAHRAKPKHKLHDLALSAHHPHD